MITGLIIGIGVGYVAAVLRQAWLEGANGDRRKS